MSKETVEKNSQREKARRLVEQQKEKEQRFKITIWIIVFAVILLTTTAVVLTILNGEENIEVNVAEEQLTPESITATNSLQIPSDGNTNEEAVRVDYFFDPQCPACQTFSEQAGETIREYVDNGAIDLHVHPVSFLGNSTNNNYSGQAANAVITVHEESPDHTLGFISAIFDPEFFPQGGTDTRTSNEIQAKAVSAGIPVEVADKFDDLLYFDWVSSYTNEETSRTDLFPDGQFGTPAIIVNAEEQEDGTLGGDYEQLMFTQAGDIAQDFENAVLSAQ